jgi:Putative transposase, YhgA-like
MGRHDLSYRLFFTHRRMIQDLLREIVGEQWVSRIDFDSGERVNASFVSHKHHNRESDVIWKFRRNDGKEPVYVYILTEFQSRPDPSMPVRLMSYESLFYQSLLADLPTAAWTKLPPVIPIVVYNGGEPWNVATDLGSLIGDLDPSAEIYKPQLRYRLVDEATYSQQDLAALNSPVAELFCIEKSRDWEEVRSSVHRLRRTVPPTEASLRRAFETWFHKVIPAALRNFGRGDLRHAHFGGA